MPLTADIPWLRVLVEYLIKTTLVVSCGLALVRVLRHRTAALRHFILLFFLAGLLFLPVLSISPAGWETRLLPAAPDGRPRPPAPVLSRSQAPAFETLVLDKGETGQESDFSGSLGDPDHSPGPRNVAPRLHLGAAVIPVIWLAVLLSLLLRLAVGLGKAMRLTKEGQTVDEPVWRVFFARCLSAVRLRRKVRLKSHPEVSVPLTWGVRKPVVLIPAGHREWTDEQRAAALVHELCHVKRADFLALILVRLSLAVFWFNPLCWLALRRLKKEQEKACDELVLRAGLRPSTYAANLLFFKRAAGVRWPASVALVGIAGRSPFQDRLASILKSTQVFQEVKMKTKLMLALSIILVVGLIGLARPSTAAAGAGSAAALSGPAVFAEASAQAGTVAGATATASQEKTAEAQEKQEKKEQEKKTAKASTIMIEAKEGKKLPLEITITYGDEAKTLKIEKSVTVKKDTEGNLFIVTADGKDIKISKSEPFRLEVKSGELSFIREGKALKVDEGDVLVTKKIKEGTVTYHVLKPGVKVVEAKKGDELRTHGVLMVDEKEGPAIGWTVRKDLAGIREKLRVLREKLKKVKGEERDLHDIQEVLTDLEADLEGEKGEFKLSVVREGDKDKQAAWVGRVESGVKKDAVTVLVKDKTGAFSIVYTMLTGEKDRATYDRLVERVKKELPEGYALDPSFEEATGAVTLKITGPAGEKAAKELIEKLSAVIKEEVKQDKK
ncbi:MAG: M56 family metallopeptidase [Candidatus Aminicenantes bacterium]|nr:M56 family metallopeptidase [Candidatus Aminicenantes bacterium]